MARPKKNSTPPKTEVDCQRLQAEYLKEDCPQSIKDEFFNLLRQYARSITLGMIKSKNFYLPPERVDEISTDAVLLTLKQYSKPGWLVRGSFAGQLHFKVLEAMYGQAEDEMTYSLNRTFNEDSDSKEVIDLVDTGSVLPWHSAINGENPIDDPAELCAYQTNTAYTEVSTIIDEAYKYLPYRTFMKFLPWLVLQFRKPRTRNIQLLFNKTFLDSKEQDAFDILLLEIRKRILERAQ